MTVLGLATVGLLAGCSAEPKKVDAPKTTESSKAVEKEDLSDVETNKPDMTEEKKEEVKPSSPMVNLNEVAQFTTAANPDEPGVEITMTKVSTNPADFPSYMTSDSEYNDHDVSKMIMVRYTFKNLNLEEGFNASSWHFQAYTKDGKALENAGYQSNQDDVGIGREASTDIYFIYDGPTADLNQVEIDYVPSSKRLATFDLPVSH